MLLGYAMLMHNDSALSQYTTPNLHIPQHAGPMLGSTTVIMPLMNALIDMAGD